MSKFSEIAAGLVVVTTAAVGGASVALADGYAQPKAAYQAPMDWSGVYFGFGSGYQWSSIDVHGPTFPVGFGISSQHDDAFVSAHLGYQLQWRTIVLGVEGGWMSTLRDRDGNHEFCGVGPGGVLTFPVNHGGDFCTARLQDILTIGGRVGWAAGNLPMFRGGAWMPYVTGGYANAGVDFRQHNPIGVGTLGGITPAGLAGGTVEQEQAHTRLPGWYIGAGFEWVISPGWTTGIEYRHYDFGSGSTEAFSGCTLGGPGTTPPVTSPGCILNAPVGVALERVRFSDTTDTVEARVSWRWGREPTAAPLK
jgi:opacity protein-like surface antigen